MKSDRFRGVLSTGESGMELHFCDLCNESVPQQDLDGGRAVRRKGRVICAQCEGAMTHDIEPHGSQEIARGTLAARPEQALTTATPIFVSTPPNQVVAPRPRGNAGIAIAVTLASLALLGTVAATAFFFERERGQEELWQAGLLNARDDATQRVRLLDSRMDLRLSELGEAIERSGTRSDQTLERLGQGNEQVRTDLAGVRAELGRMVTRLEGLEAGSGSLDRHEREIAKLAESTAELHADLLRLADQVHQVQDASSALSSLTPVAAGDPVEQRPEWWPILDELTSQNSGARWQAVQTLGNTGDPDVAEHLVAMLNDPDIFVRMATARILGDLEAVVGLAPLIDALEDPEASVREAAVVSLRSITGQNLRFDPTARESDRAKRVKAWRDWWKKASKDLLGKKVFERDGA